MKKYFLFVVFISLVFSCKHTNTPEKPENLIPKDKMVNILIDMSLFNAAKGVNKKMVENNGIVLEEYIYKKHNIDSLQFAESNTYYAYNIETYDALYKKIRDSLKLLKEHYTKIDTKEREEKRKKDSLKRKSRKKSSLLDSLN